MIGLGFSFYSSGSFNLEWEWADRGLLGFALKNGLSQSKLHFSFPQALMFWVVDNFLMRKGKTKAKLEERGANQDSRNGSKVRYRRAASHEESESEVRPPRLSKGPSRHVAGPRGSLVSCLCLVFP